MEFKEERNCGLSSSEVEYIVVTASSCQAVWLKRLLADVFQEQAAGTKILCDNKATIAMTKNPAFHSLTKHIDIRYHFIRDLVAKEEILLEYCSTQKQLADVLTKALSKEKFCYFRGLFGVCSFESRGNIKE